MIFYTKLVFLYYDVLCVMGWMNPLNTFLSLARLLRVFGQKLLNGAAIRVVGGELLTTSQLKIYFFIFGKKVHKDNLFINHILLVGKQYIYNCRCTKTNPCLQVFSARLNNVYQLETIIAKLMNKMSFHSWKWQALLTGGTQLPISTC